MRSGTLANRFSIDVGFLHTHIFVVIFPTKQRRIDAMGELRPLLAIGAAPMVLRAGPRPLFGGSVRPLCRGLMLAAALSLPALGPLAADRWAARDIRPEAVRAAVAPSLHVPSAPTGGAAARLVLASGDAR
ncbi:hypothetical protein HNR00_000828 [Methylorubrum rhodinum]|uniref:Uncharacterized protein n=2 Tax=Methylorubrum rhodinum TaxID=29428 RepID=A0A840ZDY8_9HYPH|nr:hypothetical protein [Methylorubrum rhodinum]